MSDAVIAGRWQFAFTIMFHYLFPVLTMGLGVLIAEPVAAKDASSSWLDKLFA